MRVLLLSSSSLLKLQRNSGHPSEIRESQCVGIFDEQTLEHKKTKIILTVIIYGANRHVTREAAFHLPPAVVSVFLLAFLVTH